MPTWILLSTLVVLLLVQYYVKRGFENKYIDNLFSLSVIFAVLSLFTIVSKYEGVKGLSFLTMLFIWQIISVVRVLNKTKEEK